MKNRARRRLLEELGNRFEERSRNVACAFFVTPNRAAQFDGADRGENQEDQARNEEEEILAPLDLIQQYQEKRASLNADIDRILAQITDILGINTENLT